jgi:rubrerythrin
MPSVIGLMLRPLQALVWNNLALKARNLLRFAETEADGGRDIARAAEVTSDPVLRRLFLRHARDEQRHAELFRRRGADILLALPREARDAVRTDWLTPGERGLDDLRVKRGGDASLLAFLHLSEKSAATDFATYRGLMSRDPQTRAVFDEILRDETYHMNYTLAHLRRIEPARTGWRLWGARLKRLWNGYLRVAGALAGLISGVVLTAFYFVILPPFALMARRAERNEPQGWRAAEAKGADSMKGQY